MSKKRNSTLYTVGPVQMFERTLKIKANQVPYFRNQWFSDVMLGMDKKLKKLLYTAEDTKIAYLTASGTAAMEMALANLFNDKHKLLIINGGSFGERFVKIAKSLSIKYDEVKVPFDKDLEAEDLKPFEKNKYDGVIVNIDDTSIGKLYDIHLLSDFSKRHKALFVVDAISSFLCDTFKMDEYGVDVTIFSSQKGLCVSPGIAFIAMNTDAQKKLLDGDNLFYFNIKDYFKNMERGQTPFTPAIGILLEAEDMINYIEKISLDAWLKRVENNAKYFRDKITKLGFKLPPFRLSNAVTPFYVRGNTAHDLIAYLSSKGLYINPSSGERAEDMVRVASIGDLNEKDYDRLIKEIKRFYNI